METTSKEGLLPKKHGLFYGHDQAVAIWTWKHFKYHPMPVDATIGIILNDQIVGSIIYQNFNGWNVEMSYYGPRTMSVGIVRAIFRFAIERFNAQRLTVRTNRQNIKFRKWFLNLGFKQEGLQRQYYGPQGDAVSYVMFRDRMEQIARWASPKKEEAS